MGTHSNERRTCRADSPRTEAAKALARWAAAIAVLLGLAGKGLAGDTWVPLLPDQSFYDFQLFAPPDLQSYEIYPEPSEGIFLNYDRIYMGITVPDVVGVGQTPNGGYLIPTEPISPQAIVQLNNAGIQASGTSGPNAGQSVIGGLYIFGSDPLQLNLNTSWMRTVMSWGNRYEGGWIYDNRGMQFSYFDSGEQGQQFTTVSEFAASSPQQDFTQDATAGGDGGGGVGNVNQALVTTTITSVSPPPDHLIAQKLTQENTTRIQSGGFAFLVRRQLGGRRSRSTARFGLGPKFIQFEDRFTLGYESNQYPFNVGGQAGSPFGDGAVAPGGAQGGNLQAGGPGGGEGVLGGAIGGGNVFSSVYSTSAGDVLGITGVDTLTGIGSPTALQTGDWETYTTNNMVGPEIALLLESTHGRWTFASEFKFTAAFNWQNNLYRGANFPDSLAADYLRTTFEPAVTQTAGGTTGPITLTPPPLFLQLYGVGQTNATNNAEHRFVFSPIGEWRFGTQFRVSNAIVLRAGYTGMWMAGIARASSNTGYRADAQRTQYAEPEDPSQQASLDNPWVVKTTGTPPPNAVEVAPNTFKTPNGMYYTGEESNYFRQNPIYNRIGPVNDGTEYAFTNGLDFGIEIKY